MGDADAHGFTVATGAGDAVDCGYERLPGGAPRRPTSHARPCRRSRAVADSRHTAAFVGRVHMTDSPRDAIRRYRFSSHGLRQATPRGSKCRVLRVTTIICAAWAMAAMSASSSGACSGTR